MYMYPPMYASVFKLHGAYEEIKSSQAFVSTHRNRSNCFTKVGRLIWMVKYSYIQRILCLPIICLHIETQCFRLMNITK